MILTKKCACGKKVTFKSEDLPKLNCPHCGQSLNAQFASQIPPVPLADAAAISFISPRPTAPEFPSAKSLRAVREQTCYGAMRSLIRVTFGIGYAICGLLILGAIWAAIFNGGQNVQIDVSTVLATIAVAVLAAVLLIAVNLTLLLNVDAVDVLIAYCGDRQDRGIESLMEKNALRKNAFEEPKSNSGG